MSEQYTRGTGIRAQIHVPPVSGVSSLTFVVKTYRTWVAEDSSELTMGRDGSPVSEAYFDDNDSSLGALYQGDEEIEMDTDETSEVRFRHTTSTPLGQYTMFGRAENGTTAFGFVFLYELVSS